MIRLCNQICFELWQNSFANCKNEFEICDKKVGVPILERERRRGGSEGTTTNLSGKDLFVNFLFSISVKT